MNTNAQASEALAVIRQAAAALPMGKRTQVLNRCNRIDLILRRHPSGEVDNRTDAEKVDQIVDNYNTARRIVAALLAGRTLSHRDSAEFKTTEFHTRICYARKILASQYPQYTLCSRYTDKEETGAGRPFKIYWIENAAQ